MWERKVPEPRPIPSRVHIEPRKSGRSSGQPNISSNKHATASSKQPQLDAVKTQTGAQMSKATTTTQSSGHFSPYGDDDDLEQLELALKIEAT